MKHGSRLAVLLLSLAAVPALAHEHADRAMGFVESVAADKIVIKATDGHAVAFTVTPETLFVRGEKPATREDVHVGERAVVQGRRLGEKVMAIRVRLGPDSAGK
jgi:hypothetical protein